MSEDVSPAEVVACLREMADGDEEEALVWDEKYGRDAGNDHRKRAACLRAAIKAVEAQAPSAGDSPQAPDSP